MRRMDVTVTSSLDGNEVVRRFAAHMVERERQRMPGWRTLTIGRLQIRWRRR